jgi:hypothetical protein
VAAGAVDERELARARRPGLEVLLLVRVVLAFKDRCQFIKCGVHKLLSVLAGPVAAEQTGSPARRDGAG